MAPQLEREQNFVNNSLTFKLRRLGLVVEPEAGYPWECEGVLNPGAARGPDGSLYLFPRLVAKGNYSRIGIARVVFDAAGDPSGVERLGIALEPEADHELHSGGGGCEDPRVTFVTPLNRYIMTYTAHSEIGPRIAAAVSRDLFHWTRLGLAKFANYRGIEFGSVSNKDASIFPVAVANHIGKMQMAMLHRPLFPGTLPEQTARKKGNRLVDLHHESIWLSFCPMSKAGFAPRHLGLFNSHVRLATPVANWERLKIGGGTPPILTRHGWLIVYHGVGCSPSQEKLGAHLIYSAGIMILDAKYPSQVLYRSPFPVLTPETAQERVGTVGNVVFPTGIDRRDDLGTPDRFDVYYGMADRCVGVARLELPASLTASEAGES